MNALVNGVLAGKLVKGGEVGELIGLDADGAKARESDLLPPDKFPPPFVCCMCGAHKTAVNKWWNLWVDQPYWYTRPFHAELAKSKSVRSLCGTQCLTKALQHYCSAITEQGK